MLEIRQPSGEQVIDANDGVSFPQERVAEMRAQKPRATSDQRSSIAHEVLSFLNGAVSIGAFSGVADGRPML